LVRAGNRLLQVARILHQPRADGRLRLGLGADLEHQRLRLRRMTLELEPEPPGRAARAWATSWAAVGLNPPLLVVDVGLDPPLLVVDVRALATAVD
jgi:hypothetical protein